MQIVGGRWEVCLGDGSCVLSFLSFPLAFFNLYIIVRIHSLSPGLSPSRQTPGQSLASSRPCRAHSAETDLMASPRLPLPNKHWGVFESLKSWSACLIMLPSLRIHISLSEANMRAAH